MLPQRDPEGNRAFLEILGTSLTLIPLSLVPNNSGHDRNRLFLHGSFAQFEPAIFCREGLRSSISIAGQSAFACDCHLPSSHLRDDGLGQSIDRAEDDKLRSFSNVFTRVRATG